jgi:DNA-directed RNA polymerase subunit RPC12/RpoP
MKNLTDAVANMSAQPDVSEEDSDRLREFCRVTAMEVKAVGSVSAATSLEMIGYIRELEWKLETIYQSEQGVTPRGATDQGEGFTEWNYCPACAGELDTGWECIACGRDWRQEAMLTQTKIQDVIRCAHCGSSDIYDISGEYETGVVAPDGYRERQYENGFHCKKCGRDQEYEN